MLYPRLLALLLFAIGTASATLLAAETKATPQETAALAEMQQLSNALTAAQLDTTFYVSLEALNDITLISADPSYDYLNNEGGTYVITPSLGVFQTSRRNLLTGPNPWNGPYVNYQSGRTQTALTPYDQGSPLDPWGTPYYFFTPFGLVRGDIGTVSFALYGDAFDRYTLISLGPDGQYRGGDDLFYFFGGSISGFRLSSARTDTVDFDGSKFTLSARQNQAITLRGWGLSATQNGASVIFSDGVTATPAAVQNWTAREVQVTRPALPDGPYQVSIERGALKTNLLPVALDTPPNRAGGWTTYD